MWPAYSWTPLAGTCQSKWGLCGLEQDACYEGAFFARAIPNNSSPTGVFRRSDLTPGSDHRLRSDPGTERDPLGRPSTSVTVPSTHAAVKDAARRFAVPLVRG
jgi:hypothetical protein